MSNSAAIDSATNSSSEKEEKKKKNASLISQAWDVTISKKGLDTISNLFTSHTTGKGRVSLEIHNSDCESTSTHLLQEDTELGYGTSISGDTSSDEFVLSEKDTVVFQMYLKKEKTLTSNEEKQITSETSPLMVDTTTPTTTTDKESSSSSSFVLKKKFLLQDVTIVTVENNRCEVIFEVEERKTRILKFESSFACKEFVERYYELERLQSKRANYIGNGLLLNAGDSDADEGASAGSSVDLDEAQFYLFEIVCAKNLRIFGGVKRMLDPYCVVKRGDGNYEYHRTLPCKETLNPQWNFSSASSFTMNISRRKILNQGLRIEINDHKNDILKDDLIGYVHVPYNIILDATNVESSIDIEPPRYGLPKQGSLVVKCRKSTKNSIQFMNTDKMLQKLTWSSEFHVAIGRTGVDQISNLKKGGTVGKGKVKIVVETEDLEQYNDDAIKGGFVHTLSDGALVTFEIYVLQGHEDDITISDIHSLFTIRAKEDIEKSYVLRKSFHLDDFTIASLFEGGRTRNIVLHSEKNKYRSLKFVNHEEAAYFSTIVKKLRRMNSERVKSKFMGRELSVFPESLSTRMTFLFDILSASDIPKFEAYCKVRIGKQVHHTTGTLLKSTNPIWSFPTKSLCLITTTPQDLMENGVSIDVYDSNKIFKDVPIGTYTVDYETVFRANGERLEYTLVLNKDLKHNKKSKIALRCRKATQKDIDFMASPKNFFFKSLKDQTNLGDQSVFITPQPKQYLAPQKEIKGVFTKVDTKRVQPYCDPTNRSETQFMTIEDIKKSSTERSKSWVQSGSGKVGSLFVEVIECKLHTSSDAFVNLIYEDSVVSTDTIGKSKNVYFVPWCRRAFKLGMTHISSELYISVHDYRPGPSQTTRHVERGRVTVALCNLRSGMEYILDYNLYNSAKLSPRKKFGTIRIRLGMEFYDKSSMYLDALDPDYRFNVSMEHSKIFACAKYSIGGNPSVDDVNISTIDSYIKELLGHLNTILDALDVVINIFFWRSHYPLTENFKIPLNSMILFVLANLLLHFPDELIAITFCFIGWIMLVCLGHQNENASSKWRRRKTYFELLCGLLFGYEKRSVIEPNGKLRLEEEKNDNVDEGLLEEQKLQERLKAQGTVNELHERKLAARKLTTKRRSSQFNILNSIEPLMVVQILLKGINHQIRYVKAVMNWKRSYVSFCITTGAFLLSIISIFAPWKSIFHYFGRIVVYIFLGPGMKLVDLYFIHKRKHEEIGEEPKYLKELRREVREVEETFFKKKQFRFFLFGKYTASMPEIFELDRFEDFPLSSSSAKPLPKGHMPSDSISIKTVWGQRIETDMIPFSAHVYNEKKKS